MDLKSFPLSCTHKHIFLSHFSRLSDLAFLEHISLTANSNINTGCRKIYILGDKHRKMLKEK
jgi:hypothetical protein